MKQNCRYIFVAIVTIIFAFFRMNACYGQKLPYQVIKSSASDEGIVVTAHPLASEIGTKIMEEGGNAIDAAIGVMFALAVVYPGAGNLGGGGFMVYHPADSVDVCLDFREKAPLRAKRDMYLDSLGNVRGELSTLGALSVGVPGTVSGIFEMFQKYSSLKNWNVLIEPSIELAENGFCITHREAESLNNEASLFIKINQRSTAFVRNKPWKEGDTLVQKELAQTLRRILKNGYSEFYEGETANFIIKSVTNANGIISKEDLTTYQSKWRKPLIENYKDYTLVTMPPPSSGGLALIQMLRMLNAFNVKNFGHNSANYIHLLTEVERRAYADRSKYLGDPDFENIPIKALIDTSYLLSRMKSYKSDKATPSGMITAGDIAFPAESEETTHFSIVDKYGNAVSITITLNSAYGSKLVVENCGFLLNNEMDDFSIKPGVPNQFGLIGAEANAIMPSKRMLSSMTPCILLKNAKIDGVFGSPGGATIITTVLQIILNRVVFKLDPVEIVQSGRFHSQWLPDVISVENGILDDFTISSLHKMGHEFEFRKAIGKVEGIFRINATTNIGVADRRGDDSVSVEK